MKLNATAERRLQHGLLVLAVVLAICTVAEVFPGHDADAGPPAVAPGSAAPPTVQSGESVTIEDYAVVVERPLFFEARRPYEPAQTVDAGPVKAEQAAGLILSAVVISDDRRIAIVESGRNDVRRLVPGESVGGWTLTGVEAQRALFTRGGETLTLELTVPANNMDATGRNGSSQRVPGSPATPAAEAAPEPPPDR